MGDQEVIVWSDIVDAAGDLAERWIADTSRSSTGDSLLGGLRRDPESFEFTRRLIDLVAGTDDAVTSAVGLREIAQDLPASMPVKDRIAVRAGGAVSLGLPWAVMPVARKWLRDRVSELVLATRLPDDARHPGRLTALGEALRQHGEAGLAPVIAPLGEIVHGPDGVRAEVARLSGLAGHPLVKHLVVDPGRFAPGGSDWSAEDDVRRAAEALDPLLRAVVTHDTTLHLTPTTVRWARLVPAILSRALADPSLDRARIGVRLFADLPESREQYAAIARWAQRRVADGGSPSEVTIGLSHALHTERIVSIQTGLAVPLIEDRDDARAQLLRLVELALHPGRAASLRPVIATEDPLVLAGTAALAARLDSADLFSVQLRSGFAPGFAARIAQDLPEVRLVLPVVTPQEYTGALDLLLGFAAEAADPESEIARLEACLAAAAVRSAATASDAEAANTAPESDALPGSASPSESDETPGSAATSESDSVSASAPVSASESARDATERSLFREAARAAEDPSPPPHRTQLRAREWDPSERDSALFYRAPDEPARFDTGGLTAAVLGLTRGSTGELKLQEHGSARPIPPISRSGFANEPETDASLAPNREWARGLLRRAAETAAEIDEENPTVALSRADIDPEAAAAEARRAGDAWGAQPTHTRATRLRRIALATVAARDRMFQLLAQDTGAPIAELDREVNDIVDSARYSGQLADALGAVRGAVFEPEGLALVVADESTPLSMQAESVLAALAAGSGVLWAVSLRVASSAAVLLEEWEVGGLPAGTVRLEPVAADRTLGALAAAVGIDRAVVLGNRAVARDLAHRRPDLRVDGVFPGPGTIILGPSADFGAAVSDVVASAFVGGGADPRCVRGAILMGSASRSRRFRDGLADAVRALRVGDTAHPGDADPLSFDVGPLPEPPSAAGLRALTELGRGEEWLVRPEQLDDEGLLWQPGVRVGVSASSSFWADSVGVPVLGVAHAHTLTEAIALQKRGGAVAGLLSHDADEVQVWLGRAEAATLFINRPTTCTRVERQPLGGWNESAMGLGALSGGPNRLLTLGSWQPREGTRSETLHLRGLEPEVRLLIEAAQPSLTYEDFDRVRRAALADALTWRTTFGAMRDTVDLGVERNVLRYDPVPTQVRLAEGGPAAALVRVVAAALLTRAPVSVSTGEVLPHELTAVLAKLDIEVSLERDDDWVERLAVSGPVGDAGTPAARVRLIGGDRVRAAEWLGGLDRVSLWAEPVTMAGPVELMTLLREQSVSARAHRHGLAVSVPGIDELIEDASAGA